MNYQCQYAIGERVIAQTLPARVIAVTFTKTATLYEVEYETGGAHGTVEPSEIRSFAREVES